MVSVLRPKGGTESNRCEKSYQSGKNDRLITLYTYNKISTQATSEIINLSTDCVGQCSQVSEIETKLSVSALLEVH